MDQDFAQRRRVALALAITVILVPAALLLNRDTADTDGTTPTTLVGAIVIPGEEPPAATGDGSPEAAEGADAPAGTDAMGTTPVPFLEGTVPPQGDDPTTILIPRPGQSISGDATFSRSISSPRDCQLRDLDVIPFGSTVTVTNLDNSRSVQCIVSVSGISDESVVLNPDAFLQIGDLTDAPLPVEITW